jgi:hypothetical protein
MVTDFTDPGPTPFPAVKLSPAEIGQVRKRVDDFREAVRAQRPTQPLSLNADELNALIATDPYMEPFKGKMHVTIQGDQLEGQISIPMTEIGLPAFRNRYLNGAGTFKVAVRNGILHLTAQAIEVKGKPVPEVYMQRIRTENLARNLNSDPRVSAALDRIEDVQVKDEKVVIVPKGAAVER